MTKHFFWLKWQKPNNYIVHGLLFLLLIACAYLTYATWFYQPIKISSEAQVITQKLTHHSFNRFFIPFTIKEDFHLLTKSFYGSDVLIKPEFSYLYLFFIITSVIMALAASLDLKKSWSYYLIIGLVILFISQLSLDLLYPNIATFTPIFTIGFIALFAIISYCLWSVFPNLNYSQRLLAFFCFFLLITTYILLSTDLQSPLFFIAQNAYIVPSLFSLLFILIISQEIPRVILFLSSNRNTLSSGLKNYLLGSFVYLVNIVIIYLDHTKAINSDFSFIHPYFLLIISIVFGFWGTRKREIIYDSLLNFKSNGAIIYLSGAIITLSTIAICSFNDNTPIERMFKSIIVYTHFASAILFFVYVIVNFVGHIKTGKGVYKVVYEAKMLTYNKLRVFVLGLILVLLFKDQFDQIYQWQAAREIAKADAFTQSEELQVAHEYYEKSLNYSLTSHKSNYVLGRQAEKSNKIAKALNFYKNANTKSPSIPAYLNLSNLYNSFEYNFHDTWTLEEGLKKHPNSIELLNNMALTYSRTTVLDSTFHYLNKTYSKAPNNEDVITNKLALDLSLLGSIDTTLLNTNSHSIALQNNQLVALRKLNKGIVNHKIKIDSNLNIESYALLRNLVLSSKLDYTDFIHDIQYKDQNIFFNIDLEFLEAINNYQTGNALAGFSLLDKLEKTSTSPLIVSFRYHLGMWYFEHKQYKKAFDQFSKSSFNQIKKKINNATFYAGFTAAVLGKHGKARTFLNHMHVMGDTDLKPIATKWLDILNNNVNTEEEKYYQILFTDTIVTSTQIENAQELTNKDRRNSLLSHFLDQLIDQRQYKYVEKILKEEKSIELSLIQEKLDFRKSVLSKSLITSNKYPFNIPDEKADSNYLVNQVKKNPLNPDVYILASHELEKQGNEDESYDILIQGMQNIPNSAELKIAYCYLSAKNHLNYFADEVVEDLENMLSKNEFQTFMKEYSRFSNN